MTLTNILEREEGEYNVSFLVKGKPPTKEQSGITMKRKRTDGHFEEKLPFSFGYMMRKCLV